MKTKTMAVTMGLLTVLVGTAYSQELVGKKFWCKKPDPAYYISCDTGQVTVIDYDELWKGSEKFYKLEERDGYSPWISAKHVEQAVKNGILVSYDPAAEAKKAVAKGKTDRETQIMAKDWPYDIKRAVLERRILKGMTEEQVILSRGKPNHVNTSVGSWGEHEQWVYNSQYLYFENGVLKTYQTSYRP